jgi:hypothetical protein
VNNTAFRVRSVYTALSGGNNEGNIPAGVIITSINSVSVNYDNNLTLGHYLGSSTPNQVIALESENGTLYNVNINYFPRVPGAYVFKNVYLGLTINQTSSNSITIDRVFKNSTEGGVNEGRIPEKTVITKVNGTNINLDGTTFADFIENTFNPSINDTLVFTDASGNDYLLNCRQISASYVFIGLQSDTYWIAKNWLGELFGGKFPESFRTQMLFLYLLSFSIAIFNMLPAPIFDGGRVFGEFIDYFVGSRYKRGAKKKMSFEVLAENDILDLNIRRVEDILSARLLTMDEYRSMKEEITKHPSEEQEDSIIQRYGMVVDNYEKLDSFSVGHIDSVKFHQKPEGEKYIAVLDMVYEEDELEPKKKSIKKAVSIFIITLLLANFLVSYILLGNPLMGL